MVESTAPAEKPKDNPEGKNVAQKSDGGNKDLNAKLQAEGNKTAGDKNKTGSGTTTTAASDQECTDKDKTASKKAGSDHADGEKEGDESWASNWLQHMEQTLGLNGSLDACNRMQLVGMPADVPFLAIGEGGDTPPVSQARVEAVKAEVAANPDASPGLLDSVKNTLSDVASWIGDTSLGRFAVGEARELKSAVFDPVVDWFSSGSGDWSGWYANAGMTDVTGQGQAGPDFLSFASQNFDKKEERVETQAKEQEGRFKASTDVGNAAPLTDAHGGKIELPKDAKDTGETVQMAGQDLHIHRSGSGKETYLVNDKGDVVARSKADGSYQFMMRDKDGKPDGKMDVKVEKNEKTGKYEVKHLERFDKDGRLLNKMENGALLNYDYGRDGQFKGISGMLDLRDQSLSAQQLHERLEQLQHQLGEHGQALVRARNEQGESVRLHVHNIDNNTNVITDLDHRRAEVHVRNGETDMVFRTNEKGQIGAVGPDGSWHELTPEQRQFLSQQAELKRHIELAQERAEGNPEAVLDGIRHRINERGEDVFERLGEDGQAISKLTMPKKGDESQPMVQEDEVRHERSEMSAPGKVDVKHEDGRAIFSADPDRGVETPDFKVNDRGLVDRRSGARLDSSGNVYDRSGNRIFNAAAYDTANGNVGNKALKAEEARAAIADAASKASIASSYASQAFSLMFSPGNMELCKNLCLDALGILGSVDTNYGGAKLVTVAATGEVHDALSASSASKGTYVQLASAGLNDSNYDTTRAMQESALSISGTSSIAQMADYRERLRLQA